MNAEIHQLYHSLNETQQKILKHKTADSSRLTQLIEFIEQKKKNFQNHEIIQHLFSTGILDKEFNKARNNYFKLRKKLIETIEELKKENTEILPLENELRECRKLIKEQQYSAAKRKLEILKIELENNNIFEYLHDCIYQLINVHECLATGYSIEYYNLLKEYQKAYELNYDLHQMLFLYKAKYHEDKEPALLERMSRIAQKNKIYPRFTIIYYYCKVLFGISATTPKRTAKADIKKLENSMEKHPEVPVFQNTPNSYLKIMGYWLPMIKMHYCMLFREYHEGFKLMMQYKNVLKNNPEKLGAQMNENLLRNEITACIYSENYKEALQILEELKEFQMKNGQKENLLHNYVEMANIYSFGYPKIECKQVENISTRLKELIQKTQKGKNDNLNRDAYLSNAILLFTYGYKSKAMKYFNTQESIAEIKGLKIENIQLLFSSNTNKENIISIFEKEIRDSVSPLQESYFKWALKQIKKGG